MHEENVKREEFKLSGDDLIAKVKALLSEGNARRIIIKNERGDTMLEVPLVIGAVGAIIAPVLAAIGAVAALVTKCTLIVERRVPSPAEPAQNIASAPDESARA